MGELWNPVDFFVLTCFFFFGGGGGGGQKAKKNTKIIGWRIHSTEVLLKGWDPKIERVEFPKRAG